MGRMKDGRRKLSSGLLKDYPHGVKRELFFNSPDLKKKRKF